MAGQHVNIGPVLRSQGAVKGDVLVGIGALPAGLYLGLHAKRWTSAIIAATGGIAVAELKILTQPTTATASLQEYERRNSNSWTSNPSSLCKPSSSGAVISLAISPLPFGLALDGYF